MHLPRSPLLLSLRAHIIRLVVIPDASKAADGCSNSIRSVFWFLVFFCFILNADFLPEKESSVTVAARRMIAVLPKANIIQLGLSDV